jgi:hypothetical protein
MCHHLGDVPLEGIEIDDENRRLQLRTPAGYADQRFVQLCHLCPATTTPRSIAQAARHYKVAA